MDGGTLTTQPHIACLFASWPGSPPVLADAEMQALEAAGFRVTRAALEFPAAAASGSLFPQVGPDYLFPPEACILEACATAADAAWRTAMQSLAAEYGARFPAEEGLPPAPRLALWFAREFRRRGVQQVLVYAAEALPVALFLKAAGFPFAINADCPLRPAPGTFAEEACRRADFVVVRGRALADAAGAAAPDLAGRLAYLPPGIDASRYGAALCGDAGPLRIVTCGPLTSDRGIPRLLEILHRLNGCGVEAQLAVVGSGPWQAALEAGAAGLAVQFVAPVSHEELKRTLAAADLYVHADTAAAAGLPAGIMEAMATGLPVLALEAPGVDEFVKHGATGWIVPAGDTVALAETLQNAAEMPALRAACGQRGLERMQKAFSLSAAVQSLTARLREATEGRFTASPAAAGLGVLCLLENWPPVDPVLASEISYLETRHEAGFLCASCRPGAGQGSLPDAVEFLPDAGVLESFWRHERELVHTVTALRAATLHAGGEDFFRQARRAVFTAAMCRRDGWRHVHAMRAESALWAWMVHRLTGLPVSMTVQRDHQVNSAALRAMLGDCRFGSVSDPAIKGILPDLFPAAPAKVVRRFGFRRAVPGGEPAAAAIAAVWKQWLELAGAVPQSVPDILPAP